MATNEINGPAYSEDNPFSFHGMALQNKNKNNGNHITFRFSTTSIIIIIINIAYKSKRK